MFRCLDLADFLLIAEEVLGVEAKVLQRMANLALADSALNAGTIEANFGSRVPNPRFYA